MRAGPFRVVCRLSLGTERGMRLDHCRTMRCLPRYVAASPRPARSAAACATILPARCPSRRRRPTPRLRTLSSGSGLAELRLAGCGRLPYRHYPLEPSHSSAMRGPNPLPERALLTTGNAKFNPGFAALAIIVAFGQQGLLRRVPANNETSGAPAHRGPASGNDLEIRDGPRCRDNFCLGEDGSCDLSGFKWRTNERDQSDE